jgi:farnesyl-diphosphate farnesyltransferase
MIAEPSSAGDDAATFCRAILPRVSRTFAVGIGFLSGQLGKAVQVGYLMCRIADTIEDDAHSAPSERVVLLDHFLECFDDERVPAAFAKATELIQCNAAYRELLDNTPLVFEVYRQFSRGTRVILRRWVAEMTHGMKKFVAKYPTGIRIATLDEFREYCYYVAGTVGHLLTDLWKEHSVFVTRRVYDRLLVDCEAFGEALQTVNIIKDIAWDCEHENAVYVPADALREAGSSQDQLLARERLEQNLRAVEELIGLANRDLAASLDYLTTIPRPAVQIRVFCALPLLFAVATLRELRRSSAMLESGGGVKISRKEVKSLIYAGSAATISDRSLRWLADRVRDREFTLKFA